MESKFKLIDGKFSVGEAKEVIGNLIEFKIQFHNKENFSSEIRKGIKDERSLDRKEDLKVTRKAFYDYLEQFSNDDEIIIFSEIQIKK